MIWNEHTIARAVALQTLARKCVVLVNNCNWTGHECDVLAVTNDLRVIDVEIKISRADLKADAKKDKWWHVKHLGWGPEVENRNADGRVVSRSRERLESRTLRPWPPRVWKHYYALPADVWKAELLDALVSPASGVLLYRERRSSVTPVLVECVRRAAPNKDAGRLSPADAVNIARLANLRMWDAYRQRDAITEQSRKQRPDAAAVSAATL